MAKRIHSRNKGKSFELACVKFFKNLGYLTAVTSRLMSKYWDDRGVDLLNTGIFHVQCKAVEKLEPYHDILAAMPQDTAKLNIVMHKRNRKGVVVAMTQEDFETLVNLLPIDSKEKL